MASHWTPVDVYTYPDYQTVICQVNINGEQYKSSQTTSTSSEIEVAAFIGGECRVVATTTNNNGHFELLVRGKLETEEDAAVTYKVYYNNIEYTLNQTTAFKQGAYTPIPLVINLDVVTGINVKNPIYVKQKASAFPYTVEVKDSISLVYADGYTPKNECTSNATIKYALSTQSREISINDTKVTISNAQETSYAISVNAVQSDSEGSVLNTFAGRTSIVVQLTKVQVSSIACDITTIDRFFAYNDLNAYLKDHLTILPEDADNKNYKLTTAEKGGGEEMDIPTKGGEYTVYIYPEDPTDDFTEPTVKVKVYVRPTSIGTQFTDPVEVKIGDNIPEKVKDLYYFTWPGTGEEPESQWQAKDLTYEYDPADMVDTDGKAVKKTEGGSLKLILKDGVTEIQSVEPGSSSVQFTLNITSALKLTYKQVTTDFVKNGQPSTSVLATVSVENPAGEEFDAASLGAKFGERFQDFAYAEFTEAKLQDGSADKYDIFINPKFVGTSIPFGIIYGTESVDPEVQSTTEPTINISAEQALAAGWNWVSMNATKDNGYISLADAFTTDDITEVRSQLKMMYNDKGGYGIFGELTGIQPMEATYKVCAEKATTMTLGSKTPFDVSQASAVVYKGYTWLNNPYEFDITADRLPEFLNTYTPKQGDMIITPSEFATYNEVTRSWSAGSGFKLTAGEGLVFYTSENASWTYNADMAPVKATPAKASEHSLKASDVFTYDKHAFADHMCMIATMDIDNPANYFVGAYVNDECRGYGEFVDGNTLFINAAGKTGEKVSFKLYNKFNGELTDVAETISYTGIKGSLKNPIQLSAPGATGIETSLTPTLSSREGVYNLQGQQVGKNYKGVVIKNNKKMMIK